MGLREGVSRAVSETKQPPREMLSPPREWRRGEYVISTDRDRINPVVVHGFLSRSYWAAGIPIEIVRRSIANSLCFGLYHHDAQVGFARIVTDYATFAWVSDVFILDPHRGRGLSRWLMQTIVAHPELQGFRRWVLATADAHTLYEKFGFRPLAHPERFMERHMAHVYNVPRDAAER
jgi:GNAT superfamily N-acetyltransferase